MAFHLERTTRKGNAWPQRYGLRFWIGRDMLNEREWFNRRPLARRFCYYRWAEKFQFDRISTCQWIEEE